MKKILSFSSAKVLTLCGLGLLMTLGGFWHHQSNQSQLDRMNVLNQGVGTCYNRISQTFTAMMIRDIQSPYLHQGFMGLSDECLNETIKGINPFRQNVGKGYETLNKLISEVHWFHEKVLKIHSPMLIGKGLDAPVTSLSDRFSKMESLKVSLIDEIDAANVKLREIQANDQVVMGAGLLLFVLGLSVLSLQEFNRFQLRREIENEALNLLKSGQASVGAMVDRLVERSLVTQGMPVTNQIFKDYHADLLERMASRFSAPVKTEKKVEEKKEENVEEVQEPMVKTSLKEVLVSLQNVHSDDVLQLSDVRDVQLAVEYESFEQLMNAAVNKLAEKRPEGKKVQVTNQIHSDRSVISFFLAGNTFTAGELEFAQAADAATDGVDMNLMILKEMVTETGAGWHIENKADRQGKITGMVIRLTLKRVPKTKTKLVSVMKGKKKDLTRELMN